MVPLVKGLWLSPPNRSQPAAVGSAACPAPRLARGFLNSCLPTHTVTVTVSPDTHPQPASTSTRGFSFSAMGMGADSAAGSNLFLLAAVCPGLPPVVPEGCELSKAGATFRTHTRVRPSSRDTLQLLQTPCQGHHCCRHMHVGVSPRRHPDKGLPE